MHLIQSCSGRKPRHSCDLSSTSQSKVLSVLNHMLVARFLAGRILSAHLRRAFRRLEDSSTEASSRPSSWQRNRTVEERPIQSDVTVVQRSPFGYLVHDVRPRVVGLLKRGRAWPGRR